MACEQPCDCSNVSEYEPCTENLPCCEHCSGGAPCAYAILSKCQLGFDWLNDEPGSGVIEARQGLALQYITPLWKECLFECKWSARYAVGIGVDGTGCTGWGEDICAPSLYYPCDCRHMGQGYVDDDCSEKCVRPFHPACDGAYLKPMHFGCGYFPGGNAITSIYDGGSCGWHDWYNKRAYGGIGNGYEAFENCTVPAWELEITGTSDAVIRAYITTGGDARTLTLVATYECDDWECLPAGTDGEHGNTFTLAAWPNATVPWLPKHLCVVPYSSRWQHQCDTAEDACACKDAGWSDWFATIVSDCEGLNGSVVHFVRNAELPACIPDPGGPCGYFYGTVDVDTDCDTSVDHRLHIIVWCDGTDWQAKDYCELGFTGASCTEVCDNCTLESFCPDGAVISSVCADYGDCCPDCPDTVPSVCCPAGYPMALTATLASAGCAAANGKVVTLTYVGTRGAGATEQYYWQGTFTVTGCGTLTFDFSIYVQTACEYSMEIFDSGNRACWGDRTDGILPIAVDCDLTPGVTGTYTWGFPIGSDCICCISQSVTATVSA